MKRVFLTLAAFFAILAVQAETVPINQFSGLNTDDSPLTLSNGQTADSENVITDDGPGLQGRKGFVSFATQTPRAMWEFPKSDGTRYLIEDVSGRLIADTGSGAFAILISTVPTDRVVAGSALGDKFFFADTLNGLKYWDATSVTVSSPSLKVDKLVTWKGRLGAAGITASQRVIYLSKYLDGTSWTAPTNPSDDDATTITVAGALDENIQALFSSFKDLLVWYKKNSFGGIYGSRRSNFTQRTFSDYVGVSSPETIRDCDGFLRWLGSNRIVYEFDGATTRTINDQVNTLFAPISQGDSNSRSNTQTTQAHFEAGSQSPSGFGDTTTTPGSLTPRTTTFLDTTVSQWSPGTDSPTGYTTATSAYTSLQLSTAAAISSFSDTAQSDFDGGTYSNVSSTQSVGDIQLTLSAESVKNSFSGTSSGGGDLFHNGTGRHFQVSANCLLTAVTIPITHNGSPTSSLVVSIVSDSSDSLGSTLVSKTVTAATYNAVGTGDLKVTFDTPLAILPGVSYWIYGIGGYDSTFVNISWVLTSDPPQSFTQINDGVITVGSTKLMYQAHGKTYATSGNIVSRTFDVGFTTNTWLFTWSTFTVSSTLNGGGITYQTQSSADGSSFDSLISITSGSIPTSTVRRYIRYKASLTGGTTYTPTLASVTLANGERLRPAAVFTSRAFDTGIDTPAWGTVDWTKTAAGAGGASSFFTQTSANGASWDASVAAADGGMVGSARKRYIRYLWTSTAASTVDYDKLDDMTIYAKSTGTWTSQAITIGSQISAWGTVGATLANGSGGFTIQFATSTDGVAFSSWSTISNNSIPTVSTAPYAKTRFLFDLDVGTDTPNLDDVTINWTEGSTIRAASAYINQRYWLAVALSSTTNNRVFVFDKQRQWQRYNGINIAAATLYNSKLYIGNSSGTFEAENGYTDNGTVIAAYYTTPTLVPNKLDLYSNFDYLYMTTDASDSTLATTYQINGVATNYSMGSVAMNATTGLQNFKLPFSASEVQTGKMISFKWSVSGSSFWRINNGTLYHQPLALPE